MAKEIRARVGRGVLELLEDIDLPEGKEVTVTILDAPSRADKEAFRHAAGGWKSAYTNYSTMAWASPSSPSRNSTKACIIHAIRRGMSRSSMIFYVG